jgi:hypothetical protein
MEIESSAGSIYQSLDVARGDIRLLELLPESYESDEIIFRLHTVPLADAPQFTALSYTWGDPENTETIIFNGQKVKVTSNLYYILGMMEFLKRFPLDPSWNIPDPLYIWVDAVCINQQDHKEKSHEILRMRRIYEYGDVEVHLGCSPDFVHSDFSEEKSDKRALLCLDKLADMGFGLP